MREVVTAQIFTKIIFIISSRVGSLNLTQREALEDVLLVWKIEAKLFLSMYSGQELEYLAWANTRLVLKDFIQCPHQNTAQL